MAICQANIVDSREYYPCIRNVLMLQGKKHITNIAQNKRNAVLKGVK